MELRSDFGVEVVVAILGTKQSPRFWTARRAFARGHPVECLMVPTLWATGGGVRAQVNQRD